MSVGLSSRVPSEVTSCRVMSCAGVSCCVVPRGSLRRVVDSCRVPLVLLVPLLRSCRVMFCHVVSCRVVSCHVMSCHVMSSHVMSCHVMSCHVTSRLVISRRVISRRVLLVRRLPSVKSRSHESLTGVFDKRR